MNPAPFALALLAAAAPPAALWWATGRHRPWLGLALAIVLLAVGPWLLGLVVDGSLAGMRRGWFDGAPHDWSALDQPARKILIDGIRTRLAHGKLVAGLPDIVRGLAAGGVGLQVVAWAYRRWQARRQPVLD